MASQTLLSFLEEQDLAAYLNSKPLVYIIASAVAVVVALYFRTSAPSLQTLNPKKAFQFSDTEVKVEFTRNARQLITDWFKAHPEKPVMINAETGPMMVLPPSLANEIRSDKRLNFSKVSQKMFSSHLPGFEVFGQGGGNNLVQKVILRYLTKQLNQVTEPLAEETSLALSELLSEDKEWHTIYLREKALRLIARISSRVFLGDQLCRNEEWLEITREYTVSVFSAGQKLRMWPEFSKRFVNWFLPECKANRALIKRARAVITPLVEKRQALRAEALAKGEAPPVYNDAIEWFDTEASDGEKFDLTLVQLGLSLAAIHTTTDLTSQTLADIAAHPEIIEPLREEISTIIKETGWEKTALYKMKLLDSVIKESQRVKPISMTSMTRLATSDIVLSDGTAISKGTTITVSSHNMWEETVHPDAEKWDPYRFYNMRDQPSKQHSAQLVTTGPDHLAFGHGTHACPGRFFAANEVKMALATILLKYDVALPEGSTPRTHAYGFSLMADPVLHLNIRRRDVDLSYAFSDE